MVIEFTEIQGFMGGIFQMLHILVHIVVHNIHILVDGRLANKDVFFHRSLIKIYINLIYLFIYLGRFGSQN